VLLLSLLLLLRLLLLVFDKVICDGVHALVQPPAQVDGEALVCVRADAPLDGERLEAHQKAGNPHGVR
jgi:hypothetical protein